MTFVVELKGLHPVVFLEVRQATGFEWQCAAIFYKDKCFAVVFIIAFYWLAGCLMGYGFVAKSIGLLQEHTASSSAKQWRNHINV